MTASRARSRARTEDAPESKLRKRALLAAEAAKRLKIKINPILRLSATPALAQRFVYGFVPMTYRQWQSSHARSARRPKPDDAAIRDAPPSGARSRGAVVRR